MRFDQRFVRGASACFAGAVRVIDLDRKRNASIKQISELSPRERADAVARMEENTLIVQWVQQCLEQRISSYRWALERLVIQAPDNIAADADRLIGEDWCSNLEKPQPEIKIHCKVKLLVERSGSIPHCSVPEYCGLHDEISAPS